MSRPEDGDGPTSPRKPTVVVIDDDDVVLAWTADLLEQAGYRVLTRNRPAGCVAMILQEKPELVLLDVCMPTVSGDTLVKLFARAAPNSKTIILLYSALDEPLLRSKAKEAGAHGYVTKASGPSGLLRSLKLWLRRSSSDARFPRVIATAMALKAPPPPAPQQSVTRRRVDAPVITARDAGTRPAVSSPPRRTSGSYSIDHPTVLFVDDEMLILSGYRRQLQGQPFQFDFALSGAQALRVLGSDAPPTVVVCDVCMPDPDGSEVLRQALDQDASWAGRFVIVTAQPLHDVRRQLDPRFCGSVLRKPVETDHLVAAIEASLAGTAPPVIIGSPHARPS